MGCLTLCEKGINPETARVQKNGRMKCGRVHKRLSAYRGGELSSLEQDRMRAHLADCPEYTKRYEEFQCVWDFLDNLPDIQPALGF